MRETGPLLCAAIAAWSCGSSLGEMTLAVDGAMNADRFEIRVFGPTLSCAKFDDGPLAQRTVRHCEPIEQDLTHDCHILMTSVQDGPVRLLPIPVGTRTVTILGFAAQALVSTGCQDQVAVSERETVRARITMRAR